VLVVAGSGGPSRSCSNIAGMVAHQSAEAYNTERGQRAANQVMHWFALA
jgi:hypothetical protein